ALPYRSSSAAPRMSPMPGSARRCSSAISSSLSGEWRASRAPLLVCIADTGLLLDLGTDLRPQCFQQLVESPASHARDDELPPRIGRLDVRRPIVGAEQIRLRHDDAVGLTRELLRVRGHFAPQQLVLLLRVRRVERDQERKRARAFDMAEEAKAEPLPLVR